MHLQPFRATRLATFASSFLPLLMASGMPSSAQAQTLPVVTCQSDAAVFNTGVDGAGVKKAQGSREEHWTFAPLTVENTTTLESIATWSQPWVQRLSAPVWNWLALSNAEWISPADDLAASKYTYYRYRFDLDPAVDPTQFQIAMHVHTDDNLVSTFINGNRLSTISYGRGFTFPPDVSGQRWTTPQDYVMREHFQPGTNEIIMLVSNDGRSTLTTPERYGGMAVEAKALCGAAQVSKSFTPAVVQAGDTSTLHIQVDNKTQPLTGIRQLQLQDVLPAPLELAGTPTTTCTNAVLTTTGSNTLTLSPNAPDSTGLMLPETGCSIEVPVRWPSSAASQCTGTVVTNTITPGPLAQGGQFNTGMGFSPQVASATLQCGQTPPAPAGIQPVPADSPWWLGLLGAGLLAFAGKAGWRQRRMMR